EISTYLTVTKEGISVLLVDKWRYPEPQLIFDALHDDPRIHVYPAWLRGGRGMAPEQADLFQFSRQHYDVIILGDITAGRIEEANPRTLAEIFQLVNEKGSGLLMMGGYDSFGRTWQARPFDALLPVRMAGDPEQAAAAKMVPTEAGLRHYVLRLADNP